MLANKPLFPGKNCMAPFLVSVAVPTVLNTFFLSVFSFVDLDQLHMITDLLGKPPDDEINMFESEKVSSFFPASTVCPFFFLTIFFFSSVFRLVNFCVPFPTRRKLL
jgi:hypothetical protein